LKPRSFLESIAWRPALLSGGEDCPSFGALKVTGHTIDNGLLLLSVAKLDTNVWPNVVIAGEGGIKAGRTGAVTDQLTIALLDSASSPASGDTYGIKSGQWPLFQHREGFRVVSSVIGTGSAKRGIVRPYEVKELWGVMDATLSPGSSAAMSVHFRDGGAWTDSGTNVTVGDRLLITGQSIAAGKWVVAYHYGDGWWAQAAECPTP